MPVRESVYEMNIGFDCKIRVENPWQKIPYQDLLTVRSGVHPKTLGTVTLEKEKLFQMNTNRIANNNNNNTRLVLLMSS